MGGGGGVGWVYISESESFLPQREGRVTINGSGDGDVEQRPCSPQLVDTGRRDENKLFMAKEISISNISLSQLLKPCCSNRYSSSESLRVPEYPRLGEESRKN